MSDTIESGRPPHPVGPSLDLGVALCVVESQHTRLCVFETLRSWSTILSWRIHFLVAPHWSPPFLLTMIVVGGGGGPAFGPGVYFI